MSRWGILARSQARFIARHPVGAAATVCGVALAVVAVVTTHLGSAAVRAEIAAAGFFDHTHVATRAELRERDYFALRRRWRDGELPGVEALYPVVDAYVTVGGQARRLLGIDPLAGLRTIVSPRSSGAASPAALDAPSTRRDLLLRDLVLAGPEDAAAIRAGGGRLAGVLVEARPVEGLDVLLADLPTAQRVVAAPGRVDAVWLRAAGPAAWALDWADRLLPGVRAALPGVGDPVIAGFRVASVAQWDPARRFRDASAFNLAMLALLSLLMAGFLAVQASRANHAARRRERAQLRALGVGSGELRLLAVAEASLAGLLGAGLGIALGVFVADALTAGRGVVAADVDAWVIAKAIFCALAAALAPILADGGVPSQRGRRARRGALILAALALPACLAQPGLAAAFAALLLIALLQVAAVVPGLSKLAGKFARLANTVTARANLRAAPAAVTGGADARLALGALSVAAAVAIGMGLMVESLRRDFHAMLDQSLWEGVFVYTSGDAAAAPAWVRTLPGVVDARRYGEVSANLPQGPVTVRLAVLDQAEARRYGYAGPAGALLNEVGARLLGLAVGDTAHISAAGARFDARIAHVFRDYRAGRPTLVLPMAEAARFPAEAVAWNTLAVRTEPGASGGVAAALRRRHPNADIRDQTSLRAAAEVVFDRAFAVTRGLTAVALAVAVMGLYVALAALQSARAAEFRLYAAVGMTRPEIWRLGLARTAILGGVAALAAAPLGVAIAWILCARVNPQAFGWSVNLHPDAAALAAPMLLCVAAAVLAGVLPSYRAAFRG